jgi:hypothetical protein
MALSERKVKRRIFEITGDGKDRLDDTKLSKISSSFASNIHIDYPESPESGEAILYALQQIEEDVEEVHRYLRSEVGSGGLPLSSSAQISTEISGAFNAPSASFSTRVTANDAKVTNAATNLSVTARPTELMIYSSDGTNASIPAATTTNWGVMTDEMFDDLAANTVKTKTPGHYSNKVVIPHSEFKSDGATLIQTGHTVITNSRTRLFCCWVGIEGKKVTHVRVDTSANLSRGLSVFKVTTSTGASAGTLVSGAATNTVIDITDWTCHHSQLLMIQVVPGATSVHTYGITLTTQDA